MRPDNMPRPFAPEHGEADILAILRKDSREVKAYGMGLFATSMEAAADEIERLRSALRYVQNRSERIGTHGPNCYAWGPAHWECAMGEIERLQPENAALRDVASEAELNREGIKHAHAELRRLRERIEKAPVVKVKGKIGDLATIVVSHDLSGKLVRLVVCDEK